MKYRFVIISILLSLVIGCKKDPPIIDDNNTNNDYILEFTKEIVLDTCFVIPASGSPFGYEYELENYSLLSPCFNPCNKDEMIYRVRNNETAISELWLIDFISGTMRLLVDEVWNQPKWGINDWIVFNRTDNQVWKVKSSGDSLIQLTSGDQNLNPCWSSDGEQIIYNHDDWSTYTLMIMDNSGQPVDSIDNTYFNGAVSRSNSLIATRYGSSSAKDVGVIYLDTKTDEQVTDNNYTMDNSKYIIRSICWFSDSENLLWSNGYGIFKTNIVSKETEMIKEACDNKYYYSITLTPNDNYIVSERTSKTMIDTNLIHTESDLVIMNVDGTNEQLLDKQKLISE